MYCCCCAFVLVVALCAVVLVRIFLAVALCCCAIFLVVALSCCSYVRIFLFSCAFVGAQVALVLFLLRILFFLPFLRAAVPLQTFNCYLAMSK